MLQWMEIAARGRLCTREESRKEMVLFVNIERQYYIYCLCNFIILKRTIGRLGTHNKRNQR